MRVVEQQIHVLLELAIVVLQELRAASQEKHVSLELASVEQRVAVPELRQGRIVILPTTFANVHRR